MLFSKSSGAYCDLSTRIVTARLVLKVPKQVHFSEWQQLRQQSCEFLTPWEAKWPRDDLTKAAFARRIRLYHDAIINDDAYPFFIFRKDDDVLLGAVSLSNVRRGITQSAVFGYWIGEPFARQGYMSEAVGAVAKFGFTRLGLHRLEASCIPDNKASARVLEKNGFVKEGFARSYLQINSKWRDHNLYGLLREDLDLT